MTVPRFRFTVFGTPAGQGNLKTGRSGKSYHANDAELREWRGKVRQAAIDHTGAHEWRAPSREDRRLATPCADCGTYRKVHGELLGPVRLEAVLTVARPPSVPASRRWPITRGSSDWDHYARALGDAMSGVIYVDDSQVCDAHVVVSYPVVHPDALHRPGVLIRIWELA